MPIAADWSIDTVNRIIKYVGTGAVYTANELYSWLMDTFDDPGYMDDPIPMEARTPTSYLMTNQWFIPYPSFKYLKGGGIETSDWNASTYNNGILKVTLEETGYVDAVDTDIGKTVTGSVIGDYGTLLDFDNTNRIWWIRVTTAGTWEAVGNTVSVSGGTGSGTIAANETGEWLWSNVYTLGAIRPDSIIFVYYGTYPLNTAAYPTGDKIEKWWSTSHIDILVMVREAGSLIRGGYITLFIREYMDTQDWYEIDLSAGGRSAAPLSTSSDISNVTAATTVMGYTDITIAQVNGRLNVSGETGTFQNYETVTGATSGATGIVLFHDPDLHYLILGQVVGDFSVGETITGSVTGYTATVEATLDVSYTTVSKDIGDGAGKQPYDLCINLASRPLSEFYEYLKYVSSRRYFDSDKVWFYNANTAVYTNETDDAKFSDPADAATLNDVLLPPQQTVTSGDAIYIGGNQKFKAAQFYLTTPGDYSDITIAWEYWNGTAWASLTVTDETDSFTETKEQVLEVTFTPPADWATTDVNGVTAYWIRAIATLGASPAITTAPLASQIWVTYDTDWYLVQNDGTARYTTYGECFKYAQSAYAPKKVCPFGEFLGGRFFGARGVWIENMASADAINYQLIDSNNVTRYPPKIVTIKVTSCKELDQVGVFRLTAPAGVIIKDRYTIGFSTIDKAWFYNADTAAYTDETTDINEATVDDVYLPPQQVAAIGDAIYFGSDYKFQKIRVNVSTAGDYTGITLAWQYWNGTAWTALTVTDGTNGFKTAGTNDVTFTVPADWAKTTVNGVTMFWVRCVVTGFPVDTAFFYAADTALYTDETTDINEPTANDVLLPPQQTTASGDAIYVGNDAQFDRLRIKYSTAGVYTDITLAWEYWNGTAWTALTVTDPTSGFTAAAGTYDVTWTIPADWATTTVNGVTKYWVRCVATLGAAPSITTAPLGDQGWTPYIATAPLAAQGWHWFNYNGSGVVGVTASIASDEPIASTIRIVFADGTEHRYRYQSWTGDKFILESGVTLTQDYTEGQNLYVPLLDGQVPAGQTEIENTLVYSADIPVIVRVRQKGYLPYQLETTVLDIGVTVTAIRTVDTIVT